LKKFRRHRSKQKIFPEPEYGNIIASLDSVKVLFPIGTGSRFYLGHLPSTAKGKGLTASPQKSI
jgi:hypothetical protein